MDIITNFGQINKESKLLLRSMKNGFNEQYVI